MRERFSLKVHNSHATVVNYLVIIVFTKFLEKGVLCVQKNWKGTFFEFWNLPNYLIENFQDAFVILYGVYILDHFPLYFHSQILMKTYFYIILISISDFLYKKKKLLVNQSETKETYFFLKLVNFVLSFRWAFTKTLES